MKKKYVVVATIVIVIVVLLVFKLASNVRTVQEKIHIPDTNKVVLVKATSVQKKKLGTKLIYTGTFQPNQEIMLMSQIPGEVKAVYFKEGDIVSQGKVLLQIDDAMLQSQYQAAKAAHQIALVNYERFKNASESEGISKVQLDNSWLQLQSAESQLKQLEINISKCKITSPFRGTITLRNIEKGSIIGAGTPVGRLTDISILKLEFLVPEKDITFLHKGDAVIIDSDAFPNEEFQGAIEYVSDRAENAHNYVVKAKFENTKSSKLKAGMFASAIVNNKSNSFSLTIPRLALLGSVKKPQVYIVENNKAVLRDIILGSGNDTEIEVSSGISEGEMIITSGLINLFNGCPVAISK